MSDPVEEDLDEIKRRTNLNIQKAAELSSEVLQNELQSNDPKQRIAAATKSLEFAGYGVKGQTGGAGVIVNLNLGKLADGLREIRSVGFGSGQPSTSPVKEISDE